MRGTPSEEHPFLDEDEGLTCLPTSDYEQLNNCRSCDACTASPFLLVPVVLAEVALNPKRPMLTMGSANTRE